MVVNRIEEDMTLLHQVLATPPHRQLLPPQGNTLGILPSPTTPPHTQGTNSLPCTTHQGLSTTTLDLWCRCSSLSSTHSLNHNRVDTISRWFISFIQPTTMPIMAAITHTTTNNKI